MNENGHNKRHFEFDNFRLYPHERLLVRGENRVPLTPRVFDLLMVLVESQGELISKEILLNKVWADSFVEEGNLNRTISTLRKKLGLQSNGSNFIETVPKIGYRFIAPVEEISENHAQRDLPRLKTAKPLKLWLAGAFVLLAMISGLVFYFWKSEKTAPQNENGAIRLTVDPKDDMIPRWTNDGRIRFFRTDGKSARESWIMNADGSNQTQIEDFPNLRSGIWSPDGRKVIFHKANDKTAYLADADGANEIAVPFSSNLDWSSDSKQLVYQMVVEPLSAEIFVYSLDTRQSVNVTNNPAFDADPSFSPDGKQIVFVSLREGNAEIYLMNADGSNVRRLTNHPAWDNHPVFSPDGTTIAFSSDREDENSDVYLMNTDGGDVRRLTDWKTNESVEPGCWSPDGTKIAFFSDRDGSNDIFVTSAEVFRPRLILADEKSNLQYPAYSPDGKQIVFQSEMPVKSGELRLFDAESKQTRVLLETENSDIVPSWSPDGKWIIFQNKIESNTEICLIKPDGTDLKNLTRNAARDSGAAFSPDGAQIVFASNRDGNTGIFNLYVMNADGSNQHRIDSIRTGTRFSPVWSSDGASVVFANDPEYAGNFEIFRLRLETGETEQRLTFRRRYDGNPAVSPDGKRIAFLSNMDDNSEIYLMNSDGTGLLRLTRNTADDTMPRWSPDGKKIIFSSNRDGKFALYELEVF